MVDRITPQTSESEVEFVRETFGIADKWPVLTEPYSQWVIEDNFCDGRPPLDEVGAQFVANVDDHKLVKTRLLNGTHIAMSCLASLAGYRRTDEAMGNEVIYDFVEQLMRDEVQPLLPAVPGMNTPEYRSSLLVRLSNPQMSDQLSRLARRGSEKIASFLLPSLTEAIEQDRPHTLLMLALAGWIRYLRGTDLKGCTIEIDDPEKELLTKLATMDGNNPDAVAAPRDLRRASGDSRVCGPPARDDHCHRRKRCRGHIAPVVAGRRRGVGVVMSQPLEFVRPFDPASITTLLLDADDNLFPSESPAFDASAEVTTQFLARFGVDCAAERRRVAEEGCGQELSQHRDRPGRAERQFRSRKRWPTAVPTRGWRRTVTQPVVVR